MKERLVILRLSISSIAECYKILSIFDLNSLKVYLRFKPALAARVNINLSNPKLLHFEGLRYLTKASNISNSY